MNKFLFVYGTLRKDFDHPMASFLNEQALWIGFGHIHAKLFDLGSYPGIVLSSNYSDEAYGDLYEVTDSKLMTALDQYEGNQYTKANTTFYLSNKEWKCLVYELIIPTKQLSQVYSGDYLKYLEGKSN